MHARRHAGWMDGRPLFAPGHDVPAPAAWQLLVMVATAVGGCKGKMLWVRGRALTRLDLHWCRAPLLVGVNSYMLVVCACVCVCVLR